jgi:hypothetical protein
MLPLLRLGQASRSTQQTIATRKCESRDLKELPIPGLTSESGEHRRRHDEIVRTVSHLCDLREQALDSRLPEGQRRITRQIAIEEAALDRLVFALYGLNGDQIQAVERQGRSALGSQWEAPATSEA